MTKIICDIWGGENTMDHIARSVLPVRQALELARIELEAGFLVNLRKTGDGEMYTDADTFDERVAGGRKH